jgi:putative membrane protein
LPDPTTARGEEQATEPPSYADQDPRFALANERTALAWISASAALLTAGLAVDRLSRSVDEPLMAISPPMLVTAGLLASLQAWLGWRATEAALRRGEQPPRPALGIPMAALVCTAGLALLIAQARG